MCCLFSSMEKSKGRCSPIVRQCFVTSAVCINILGHGCFLGFPAVLLPQLSKPDAIIPLDAEANSWIASMMMLPMTVGNFLTPTIMNRLGRRTAHVVVIVTCIFGWIITAMANSFTLLVVGRALHGLSFGMNLPLRSVLIGEYTSPRYRGAFLMLVSLAQASGIFTVHLIGSLLDWQKTALICNAFTFTSLIMTLYTPESPSYLASVGNVQDCRKTFRWLRGDEEEIELEELIEARSDDYDEDGGAKEIFQTLKQKEFYKPVTIMLHLNAMLQFSGGTTMATYSTLIIGLILGPSANAAFWMIFLDVQRIISNTAAVYVINKNKRRTMLFLIGGLSIASHFAIAGYVFAKNKGVFVSDVMWIPVILMNLQIFTVATGMVPLPNVIAGEIFPFKYRGLGGSVSVIGTSVVSFTVLKTFPVLSMSIGIEGLYAIYGAALTYFLIVLWFVLPETKGKTLQQIEEEFRGDSPSTKETRKPLNVQPKTVRKINTRKFSVISNHSLVVEL